MLGEKVLALAQKRFRLLPETPDEQAIAKGVMYLGALKVALDEFRYARKKEREEGVDWL